jgi:hypothetical protein
VGIEGFLVKLSRWNVAYDRCQGSGVYDTRRSTVDPFDGLSRELAGGRRFQDGVGVQ